jgi:HK97 family phage major capsid protein
MNWRERAQEKQGLLARADELMYPSDGHIPTNVEMHEVSRLHREARAIEVNVPDMRQLFRSLPVLGGDSPARDSGPRSTPEYSRAFKNWLRTGTDGLDRDDRGAIRIGETGVEYRDQVVGTGISGGFIVPPDFQRTLVEAMLLYGGVRANATIARTDAGADLPVPTVNDTAQVGAILAETGVAPAQDIGAFGQVVLHSYMYTSKMIRASIQLLQDSFFPLDDWLARVLGTRIGRIQNTHFTVGTGTGQPNGIVTAATLGKTCLTGQTLTILYADLIDLVSSVDPAYRVTGKFMMSDKTLSVLRKITDAQNRPLFYSQATSGMSTALPDNLLGYPFVINQDMAVPAANAKTILFGALDRYFVRDAGDLILIRLDERYMDQLEVGFMGVLRSDGNLIDAATHPVKYLAQSAT